MNLLNPYLQVKTSILPGCGKGLFTKIFIPKGIIITEHTGKITSFKDADHDEGNNPYLFYVSRDHVIDGRGQHGSIARFINDASGYKRIAGLTNNSKYIIIGKRVFISAIKEIMPNDEIFIGYGKGYWESIKKNNSLKELMI
jgi:SET domain-containing protein